MSPKIWNHSVWIQATNPATLKAQFDRILAESTFNVLHFSEYHFEPQGWTALWLLGESHLAIHTFPEHGTAYVELSSCMLDKYTHFLQLLEGPAFRLVLRIGRTEYLLSKATELLNQHRSTLEIDPTDYANQLLVKSSLNRVDELKKRLAEYQTATP